MNEQALVRAMTQVQRMRNHPGRRKGQEHGTADAAAKPEPSQLQQQCHGVTGRETKSGDAGQGAWALDARR